MAALQRPASAHLPMTGSPLGQSDVALQMRRQRVPRDQPLAPPHQQRRRKCQDNPQRPMPCDQRVKRIDGPQAFCSQMCSHFSHSTSRPRGRSGSNHWVRFRRGIERQQMKTSARSGPGCAGVEGKPDDVRRRRVLTSGGQGCSGANRGVAGQIHHHVEPSLIVVDCPPITSAPPNPKRKSCTRHIFSGAFRPGPP